MLRALAVPRLETRRLVRAIEAAGRTRNRLVVGPLGRLSDDPRPAVRRAVARALGRLARVEAVTVLLRMLQRGGPGCRAAVSALGAYPLPGVRLRLSQIAADSRQSRRLRLAAVGALSRHRTREAERALREAAAGSVEVQLRSAAKSAAAALGTRASFDEPRLSSALLALLGGDRRQRIAAVRQLGTLGIGPSADARVLQPLLYASQDRTREVRIEALEALGDLPAAEAERALAAVVGGAGSDAERRVALVQLARRHTARARRALLGALGDRRATLTLRRGALRALGRRPHSDVQRALVQLYQRRGEPAELRSGAAETIVGWQRAGRAATSAASVAALLWRHRDDADGEVARESLALLQRHYPTRLAALQAKLPRPPDRRGLLPLLGASAALGSTGFYALAKGAGGANPAIAALSGAVLGGGTAFLLNLRGELSIAKAATFATLGGWGAMAGLAGGLAADLDTEQFAWPLLGGELLGVVGGMLAMRHAQWSASQLALVNLTAAQASVAGVGAVALVGDGSSGRLRTTRGLLAGLLPLGGLAISSGVADRIRLTGADAGLIAYSSLLGGYLGGLASGAWTRSPDSDTVGGAIALGESAGYIGGLVAASWGEAPADAQGWLWMSTYGTSAAAAGAALLAQTRTDQRARRQRTLALAQGGAAAGALVGALTRERLSFRGRDLPLALLSTTYGGWLGAWMPTLLRRGGEDGRDDAVLAGGLLLGTSTGMLAGDVISRLTDVRPATVGLLAVSTGASTMVGGGLGLLLPALSPPERVGLMHATSAVGLAAGAALASRLRYSAADVGLSATLAAYGGWSLAFVPALWRDEDEEIPDSERAGGVLLGVGLGTLAGMGITQWTGLDGADVAELAIWTAGGASLGGGLGLVAGAGRRVTAAVMEAGGAAGMAAGALLASRLRYSGRDRGLIVHLGIGGALQGTMLPELFDEEADASQRAGGSLVGLAGGMLAGALIAQRAEPDHADAWEMTLSLAAGDALGAGIGLLAGLGGANVVRLTLATGTALWVGGGLWSPHTRYGRTDRQLVGFCGLYGSFLGAWVPGLKHAQLSATSASELVGGLAAGFGAGTLAGGLLAQRVELGEATVSEMSLVAAGTSLFGAGLGLMLPVTERDQRPTIALIQGAGLVGAVVGGALADRTSYDGPDRLLTTLAVAYGGWQGLGASLLFDDASARQVGGAVMATAGLGGLAGALVSQYVHTSHARIWTLFSGSVWGAWIGGFSANLARNHGAALDGRTITGITMLASDAGLLLSSVALSPLLDWSPRRLGWINFSGLIGMSLATGIGAIFSGDAAQIGTIAGSGGGLAAGVIITSLVNVDPRSAGAASRAAGLDRRARPGRRAAPGGSGSAVARPGKKLPLIADWAPAVQMQPAIDPSTGRQEGMRLTVGVTGLLH